MSKARSYHRPSATQRFRTGARVQALFFLCALTTLVAPARAAAQWPPDSLTNLRVFPEDITVGELTSIMADFTRALGVRCTHCHVGEEGRSLATYDFASDDKATKRKARIMIEMVNNINGDLLAGLEERATPSISVQCVTCHRGAQEPRMLEDLLVQAYESGGIDAAIETYNQLRADNYGRFTYDFGAVPLVDAAGVIIGRGAEADGVRLLELNVQMNPQSPFARGQLINFGLAYTFAVEGTEAGKRVYAEFRDRFGASAFPEPILNSVGYALLRRGEIDAAVAVFELNVEAYPAAWNAYDSLGEGLAARGDTEAAIRAYERSLELNPDNTSGAERLRILRGGG